MGMEKLKRKRQGERKFLFVWCLRVAFSIPRPAFSCPSSIKIKRGGGGGARMDIGIFVGHRLGKGPGKDATISMSPNVLYVEFKFWDSRNDGG